MRIDLGYLGRGRRRKLGGKASRVVNAMAIAVMLNLVYQVVFHYPTVIAYRAMHVAAFSSLAFLLYTPNKKTKHDRIGPFDMFLAALSFVPGLYIWTQAERIITRWAYIDAVLPIEFILGIIMLICIFEAARRVLGWILPLIALAFFTYPFAGPYIPGIFGHRGFEFKRVIECMFLTTTGVYGAPTKVASTFAPLFMLFGGLMTFCGAADFMYDFARVLVGWTRGGVAKTSVISSALFGMISGSPTANVAGTGSFTIPMMKRSGYSPEFAAAVETASSCGGTITPPVMGSVVFLMSEIIGVPYSKIVLLAILPAFYYYISVFTGIHIRACQLGLKGTPRGELPRLVSTLRSAHLFVVPLGWLVYRLFTGLSPARCAFEAMVVLLALGMLKRETRPTLAKIASALSDAAPKVVIISLACAMAGITVGVIQLTGASPKLTTVILGLAHGTLAPALILSMVVVLLLGMGMNITAAYVLAASVAGPALVAAGLDPIPAHLFLVFYAAMATMTPPVALSAYTAASMADANPMRTGWLAVRLGVMAYLLPYMFIYRPEILLIGHPTHIMWAAVATGFGAFVLASGLARWVSHKLDLLGTSATIAAGVGLLYPHALVNVAGFAVFGAVYLRQRSRARTRFAAAA